MESLARVSGNCRDNVTVIIEVTIIAVTPYNFDTDSDGLSDSAEINTYATNPQNTDTDNDGLNDGARSTPMQLILRMPTPITTV